MCHCPLRAEPQVPPLHEEVDTVRLGRDGVVLGSLDGSHLADAQLIPAHCSGILYDRAGDFEGGFLAKPAGFVEEVGRGVAFL